MKLWLDISFCGILIFFLFISIKILNSICVPTFSVDERLTESSGPIIFTSVLTITNPNPMPDLLLLYSSSNVA